MSTEIKIKDEPSDFYENTSEHSLEYDTREGHCTYEVENAKIKVENDANTLNYVIEVEIDPIKKEIEFDELEGSINFPTLNSETSNLKYGKFRIGIDFYYR